MTHTPEASHSPDSADPLAARIDALRADTPGTDHVAHLNNAGSALPPAIVTDTVVAHLRREELFGGYEVHAEAEPRVSAARDSVGRLVGAVGSDIAFAESATVAWGRGLQAIVNSGQLRAGDEVLVASSEYASNVIPLLQLQRSIGVKVRFVPDGPDGSLDVEAFAGMLGPRTALVAITHAPSQNGLINDVVGVGAAMRAANSRAWYLVDACQSVGQIPVDVRAIGCDFLSATGRKFLRGPRGTGFLTVSARALAELEPFPLDLNSAEWVATGESGERFEMAAQACARYEPWEKSYATVLGLGAAANYALDLTLEAIAVRIGAVAASLRAGLAAIEGVTVNDRGSVQGGIVTFMKAGVDARDSAAALRSAGINVSFSPPDYALRDFVDHGISGQVRLSPHVFTSDDEVARVLDVVAAPTSG